MTVPLSLVWNFPDLLSAEKITVYALHKRLAQHVSRGALYKWAQRAPQSIDTEMLGFVLAELRSMTGKDYQVNDVFEYTLPAR